MFFTEHSNVVGVENLQNHEGFDKQGSGKAWYMVFGFSPY